MLTIIIFIIIFWLPAALVVLFNTMWDLQLWQAKEYSFKRMYHYLRWDFEPTHRKHYKTIAKVIFFVGTASLIISPTSPLPLVAILLAFAFWVSDSLIIGENLIYENFPRLRFDFRNTLILGLTVFTLTFIPSLLAWPLLDNYSATELTQLQPQAGATVPTNTTTGIIIPDVYIFLAFATLIAIALDLASPIVTSFFIFISSPFVWIYKQMLKAKTRNLLSFHQDSIVIAITGSNGKTTIKKLLKDLLAEDYDVFATAGNITNIFSLCRDLNANLPPQAKVIITDLNAFADNQIAEITQLLPPNFVIFSGVDSSHIALFGSVEKALEVKSEAIQNLQPGGKVIANADDELVLQALEKYDLPRVLYALEASPQDLQTYIRPEENYYHLQVDTQKLKGRLNWKLSTQQQELKLSLEPDAAYIPHSLLASLAAAAELGQPLSSLQHKLAEVDFKLPAPASFSGDSGTTILVNDAEPSLKTLENDLEYLQKIHGENDIIFVTTGIRELGIKKHQVYSKLAKRFQAEVDVLISFDKHLLEAVEHQNVKVDTVQVRSNSELLYAIRQRQEAGDVIFLSGEFDALILQQLRSELS